MLETLSALKLFACVGAFLTLLTFGVYTARKAPTNKARWLAVAFVAAVLVLIFGPLLGLFPPSDWALPVVMLAFGLGGVACWAIDSK